MDDMAPNRQSESFASRRDAVMRSASPGFWRWVAAVAMTATVAIVAFSEVRILSDSQPPLSAVLIAAAPLAINGAFAYLLLRRFGGLPQRRGKALTAAQAWDIARRVFLMGPNGIAFVGAPRFVDDDRVEYDGIGRRVVIERADLFGLEDTENWRPFLQPPAQWLHVVSVLDDGVDAVFTLRRSVADVTPGVDPVVNVAWGETWRVELR